MRRTPLVPLLLLAACAMNSTSGREITEADWEQVREGMTSAELQAVLGKPNAIEREGPAVTLVYTHAKLDGMGLFSTPTLDMKHHRFRFVDDKLEWKGDPR